MRDTLIVACATVVYTTVYYVCCDRSDERTIQGNDWLTTRRSLGKRLGKAPSVAHSLAAQRGQPVFSVTRPEAAEDISSGNVDIIVYLARHDNEEIFPQDIEQRFGVTRSTSCRVLGLMEQKGLIAREPVKRDARLKKIVLTNKSRHIAEVLRDNAKNMERILLEGLEDDQIRQFMHVLDVMQTNLVKTGLIGDESRYSSLEIQEQDFGESRFRKSRRFRKNRKNHAMDGIRIIAILMMNTFRAYCECRRKWRSQTTAGNTRKQVSMKKKGQGVTAANATTSTTSKPKQHVIRTLGKSLRE